MLLNKYILADQKKNTKSHIYFYLKFIFLKRTFKNVKKEKRNRIQCFLKRKISMKRTSEILKKRLLKSTTNTNFKTK